MSLNFLLSWTTFAALCGYVLSQDFDAFLLANKCSRSDPQLNECFKKMFNNLNPYLAKGIPKIGLPPMDPIKIDALELENTIGNIRIKGLFSNVVAIGVCNYTIKEVRSDSNKLRVDLGLNFPYIKARGRYEVDGQVLQLPIISHGEFIAEFTDVNAIGKLYEKHVMKDGDAFLTNEKLVIDFVTKSVRIRVKDQGHPQLNKVINEFLNQNSKDIVKEMRKPFSKTLAKAFKNLLDAALPNLPMRLWLTD